MLENFENPANHLGDVFLFTFSEQIFGCCPTTYPMSMDPKAMARAVSAMFPNHDFPTILGLCEEMKDENKVVDYLREHPDGGWSQEKKKEQRGEKQGGYRPSGQRPYRPKGEKKEKEEQAPAPKPKKAPEFAKSSNATWGDIKFDSNNEIVKPTPAVEPAAPPPIPPQAAHPPPKPEQPKAPEPKPAEPVQKPAQNVEPPKETPAQPPKPVESEPPRAKKLETTLYIPRSLERVTPQMNKFGVFAGPVQRQPEPVKEVAQPAAPQQQPQRKRTELKVGAQQHVLDLPAEQPQPQPQPQAPRPQQQQIDEEPRKPQQPAPQQQQPHDGNMPYMQFMPYGMFGFYDPETMYRMQMQMGNPMGQNQADERARQSNTPPGFPPVGFGPAPNGMYPMYPPPPPNQQQFPRDFRPPQPGMYGYPPQGSFLG